MAGIRKGKEEVHGGTQRRVEEVDSGKGTSEKGVARTEEGRISEGLLVQHFWYTVLKCGIQCTAPQKMWKFKAPYLRRVPAWTTHPLDPRSRLVASLRTWATTAPKGVWRHVQCGPSNPAFTNPLMVVCTSETASFLFCASVLAQCSSFFLVYFSDSCFWILVSTCCPHFRVFTDF